MSRDVDSKVRSLKLSREHGGALLNVALALIVGLSVVAAAWKLGSMALERSRTQEIVQLVDQVRDGVFSSYRTRQNYSGLNTRAVYDMGAVDRSIFSNPNTIPLPGGGNLIPAGVNYTNLCAVGGVSCFDGFYIELRGVSKDVCTSLYSSRMGKRHRQTNIYDNGGGFVHSANEPPSINVATNACNRDASRVRLYFY
jgi:hypothetical protein